MGLDNSPIALDQFGQPADQIAAARVRVLVRVVGHRMPPDLHFLAIGQHDLHADDVPTGRAVPQPVAAGIIQGQDAAHRRHAAGRRVRSKLPSECGEITIELPQDNAGLHGHRVGIEADDPPHRPAEIEQQPASQRFAGQSRAGPAGMDGDRLLGGIPDGRLHIGSAARPHDSQRPHLIDAGVGGVH
jgi:hypothetical protein